MSYTIDESLSPTLTGSRPIEKISNSIYKDDPKHSFWLSVIKLVVIEIIFAIGYEFNSSFGSKNMIFFFLDPSQLFFIISIIVECF